MKPSFRSHAFLAATLALSAASASASDDFAEGDIGIAFYQVTGSPPNQVVGQETYVFNLGQASLYRTNTRNDVPVSTINPAIASSNIGADLSTLFGDDWADSGTVYWCVVGGVSQIGSVTNGDPARTNYLSRARASLNSGATGPGTTIASISSTNRGILTNKITPFLKGPLGGVNDGIHGVGSNTSTSGANLSGVILPTTNAQTVDEYLPPAMLTYFDIVVDPRQRFNAGTVSGTAGVEGALDLYRVLHTTLDADLTTGSGSGNAVVGQGQFIGALTLDSAGNLKIQAVGASTPPTGNFASWATANGVTGGPNGDSDHDGIPNLTEYALALDPAKPDGAPGSYVGNTLTFIKRPEAVTNNDVAYAIEESDDLGILDPWQVVTPTTNSATQISYTLPAGGMRKFARLRIIQTP